MGIFRRKQVPTLSATTFTTHGPFRFVVEDLFLIKQQPVFTGKVESGTVSAGADVVLHVGPRTLSGRVSHIEGFRKRIDSAGAGTYAGLFIDGIKAEDLSDGSDTLLADQFRGAVISPRRQLPPQEG